MTHLPESGLAAYRAVLDRLRTAGYAFRPVSELPEPVWGRTCYLRHDVDLHLTRVDEMARVEAEAGARASWPDRVRGAAALPRTAPAWRGSGRLPGPGGVRAVRRRTRHG